MLCCLTDAWKSKISSIEGVSVNREKIFADLKDCGDDQTPYVILRSRSQPGLRTSSGVQRLDSFDIRGYFGSKADAIFFRSEIEKILFGRGCVDLGECGCFCVQQPATVNLVPAAKGSWSVVATFVGSHKQPIEES